MAFEQTKQEQAKTEQPKSEQVKEDKEPVVVAGKPAVPTVNWDDSSMRTTYANVVNASSTREEVTLFFGTNLTWNPGEAKEFNVRLNDRVVLNPYAAKRLWILIGALLKEYETRFGPLKIDVTPPEASRSNNSAAA